MSCIDVTAVIDICDEIYILIKLLFKERKGKAGMYTDSLVSVNSNYVIKFIVEINFTNLLFYP